MKNSNQSTNSQDVIFNIIMLLGAGLVIYNYSILIGPMIISGLVAYLLYPWVTWLSGLAGVPRRKIVPLVYLGFVGFLIWAVIFLVPNISAQASQIADQLAKFPAQIKIMQPDLEKLLGFKLPLEPLILEIEQDINQIFKPGQIFRIIQGASQNIVWVIIIIITSFHLLRDWELLREWIFSFAPKHLEPDFRRLHTEIKVVWAVYLRGQLLVMTILGVVSGIGAAAVGIPGALVLGFLAGALALVPTLGPATATTVAALVAWIQGSSYLDLPNLAVMLIVILIFQGIQLVEGFWLTPRIISRRLNLHPGLILVTIVGTLFTLGALMALIVLPLMGSLDLVFKYLRRRRAGLPPWPEDAAEETDPQIDPGIPSEA